MATKKVIKDKFKTNKFAKKWKGELSDEVLESANQVKSWNKYGIGYQLVSTQSLFWAFVLGFCVGAILLTNFI